MKKKIMTLFFALLLIAITVYGASALEIKEITDKEIHVGTQFSYDVNLTSYEGVGNLSFVLTQKPTGMIINNAGKINWTPLLIQAGAHQVTVKASNGTHENETTFQITAIHGLLTLSLNNAVAPRFASVGQEYKFKLVASSNYPLAIEGYNYQLVQGPTGMVLVNDELIWTPTIAQIGSHLVRVSTLPKNAPSNFTPLVREFTISVQGLTIDRVEVRADSRRLETISRANYLADSTPYSIDREANLGETIELRISVRNNLPSETDNELRDVEIEIYSYDLEAADGLTSLISRIRPGRTEDQTITFYLDPKDLHPEDAPFDFGIRVSGETRDGIYYSDVWQLELKMESRSYNLIITNIAVSPTAVCSGERIRVNFDLRNIGTRDLSSAGIKFDLLEFNISEWERNIKIDYDSSRAFSRFITIPENAVPGEYFLEVTTYPRMTSSSDTRTEFLKFSVRSCQPVKPPAPVEEKPPVVVVPSEPEIFVPGTPVSEAIGTDARSIFDKDSKLYIILLTVLVVLFLIGIILLLIKLIA